MRYWMLMIGICLSFGVLGQTSKRIALTFDDAPRGQGPMLSGEARTTQFIAALNEAKVGPVAMFVTPRNFTRPGDRERIRRYAEAGHLIANHTNTHPWAKRTELDVYLAEIDRAETLLAGMPNRRAWFRFPYLDEGKPLAHRDAIRAGLRERELMNGYVTVDNYDWYVDNKWKEAVRDGRTVNEAALRQFYIDLLLDAARFYDDVAMKALGRSPAHVLLLHENDLAAHFIGDLVHAFREEGWEIISPDEAYADPIATQIPKTIRTSQGRVAALAIDGGVDPRTMRHYSIEEDQIDAMLAERGVFGEK